MSIPHVCAGWASDKTRYRVLIVRPPEGLGRSHVAKPRGSLTKRGAGVSPAKETFGWTNVAKSAFVQTKSFLAPIKYATQEE